MNRDDEELEEEFEEGMSEAEQREADLDFYADQEFERQRDDDREEEEDNHRNRELLRPPSFALK